MKLGDYNLIQKIAVGGVAEIYLAKVRTVSNTEKYLICKCLKQSLTQDNDFLNSIINEVQCCRRLNHPNIIQVFDLCSYDEHAFLTMEYMDAGDMCQILRKNAEKQETVPYDIACYAIGQAALGLHFAHELTDAKGNPLNLVHRDISPENILFNSAGDIKIADFGIAKTSNMPDITPDGEIKGKFNYMSPEQAWGDKLDRRSDLFSLAIVLYEITLGVSFYPEDSIDNTIQCARVGMFKKPHEIRPDYPAELEEVILMALDLDKQLRYKTVIDFKLALDNVASLMDWHADRQQWLNYLKKHVDFPATILPCVHVGDIERDENSILKPSTIYDNDEEDLERTNQISDSEIDELLRAAVERSQSSENLQHAAVEESIKAAAIESRPSMPPALPPPFVQKEIDHNAETIEMPPARRSNRKIFVCAGVCLVVIAVALLVYWVLNDS